MKIRLVSDLHIEFDSISLPTGDILIIAGDLVELRHKDLLKHFFDYHSKIYNQIIVIPGNHEFYHHNIPNAIEYYEKFVLNYPNVYLLNNSTLKIDNYNFIGTTLWTRLSNPIACFDANRYMNDFKLIRHRNYIRFRAEDSALLFKENIEFIKNNIKENTIIVSHHAPSYQSISEKYKGDPLNDAYCSNLDYFILDNPDIKYWFHGHVHSSHCYNIGNTIIACNPKGYGNENKNFNEYQEFDLR